MNERWQKMSAWQRRWVVIGAAFAALVVLTASLNSLGSTPGGPGLSSYSTDVDGLAAYEALLATSGFATTRARVPIDDADLSPTATLVAIGQTLGRAEQSALADFVRGGGRAIVGGPEAQDALAAVGDRSADWTGNGTDATQVVATDPEFAGVRDVRGEGFGEWSGSVASDRLLARGTHVTAIVRHVGAGQLVALADPSPLTNAWLDVADNAGLGVALVGAPGRAVVFAEFGHGYGVSSGLAGLPDRVKTALWFAAIAAVVGAFAAGKRFGPVDPVPADEAPPRVRYVEAVASTLARSRDRAAAMEPLRTRATRLATRHRAVLTDDEAASLTTPITTDDDVLALGRAAAKLEDR